MTTLIAVLSASLVALVYAGYLAWGALKQRAGGQEIAYFSRRNLILLVGSLALGTLLYFLFGLLTALAFAVGALAALKVAWIGILVAGRTNSEKGCEAARYFAIGLALLSLTLLYWFTADILALVGYGLGVALISVFTRLFGSAHTEDSGAVLEFFETYSVSVIAVMLIAHLLLPKITGLLEFPLLVGAVTVLASISGSLFSRFVNRHGRLAVTVAVAAVAFLLLSTQLPTLVALGPTVPMRIFGSLMIGLGIVVVPGLVTRFYASKKFYSLKAFFQALPAVLIGIGIYYAFVLAGLYGIALVAVSVAALSHGLSDASGSENAEEVSDALSGGYAILSASLLALVLFAAYTQELREFGKQIVFQLADVRVLVGLLAGALMPYLVSTPITSRSEVVRGLPAVLIPLVLPLAVAFVIGPEALGGLLAGTILAGLMMASSATFGLLRKGVSVPAVNSMVKVAGIVALLLARFI